MKTIITIKSDKEVKEHAQKLAQELGLSLSDVVNASLRNFLRTREVYVSAIPRMTPELENLLGVVEKDIKAKRNTSQVLASANEAAVYLSNL